MSLYNKNLPTVNKIDSDLPNTSSLLPVLQSKRELEEKAFALL